MNERNVVLGLTWMDSAKFLIIPFALLLVVVSALHTRRDRASWLGVPASR